MKSYYDALESAFCNTAGKALWLCAPAVVNEAWVWVKRDRNLCASLIYPWPLNKCLGAQPFFSAFCHHQPPSGQECPHPVEFEIRTRKLGKLALDFRRDFDYLGFRTQQEIRHEILTILFDDSGPDRNSGIVPGGHQDVDRRDFT